MICQAEPVRRYTSVQFHRLSGDELARLLLAPTPLAPETIVLDVAQRFLDPRHAGLLSLPVVAADARPLGVISRYELMRVFLMPYGRELYGRRPIAALMNPRPLQLPLDTPIADAARAIALHIQSPITEDFVLVDGEGAYAGTGLVLDVLRAVEDRLEFAILELEDQAGRRLQGSVRVQATQELSQLLGLQLVLRDLDGLRPLIARRTANAVASAVN